MFPDETHVTIVRRIDALEAEVYGLYRRLERLRLDLQAAWHVLPSGARWTPAAQDVSAHSAKVGDA